VLTYLEASDASEPRLVTQMCARPKTIWTKDSRQACGRDMKDYSQEDYDNAVSELVSVITKKHEGRVEAVYAGGSFARGDFVPGRSDMDIYVVLKDGKEELHEILKREVLEIERKHFKGLKSVIGAVLDITLTTEQEIEAGQSFLGAGFEYSNFINEGRLLWGRDVKPLIPKPSEEKQKESAKTYLKKVYETVSNQERSLKLLRWIPLKLVPRGSKERWTREAFNLTFRAGAVFLGSHGIYVSKKEDIVNAFNQHVKEENLCSIISLASSLWEKWKAQPLNDKETKQLLENSFKFVKGLQCKPSRQG
jgi:predicted nucleotidyltransferase